ALAQAGFGPNQYQVVIPRQAIDASLADGIVRFGNMATAAELAHSRGVDDDVHSPKVSDRLEPPPGGARNLADDLPNRSDLIAIIAPLLAEQAGDEPDDSGAERQPDGFVYLLKSGRHCKIGYTFDVGRRRYDLGIQLPEAVEEVHAIRTDDPVGIERYWHER